MNLTWPAAEYDALSGVAYYEVLVNGSVVVPAGGGADGRIYVTFPPNPPPSSITIEDMPPGVNSVVVRATDRALNEGDSDPVAFRSDPDTPTISIAATERVGKYVLVTPTITELGGIKRVDYYDGNVHVATKYNPGPYDYTMSFGHAGWHTVKVVVTDRRDRQASATKSIYSVNASMPTISRMKDSPDPFYPIKHDHYKDTTKITYRLSERAYVTLQIFDSAGTVVRTMSGWRRAGSNSFTWDGKNSSRAKVVGKYTYQLTANDGGLNLFTSGTGKTEIRSYYLRRLSRRRVRVVFS
jgi:hypothetical protein